ncbi:MULTISPECIES: hypothetical protein [unclassified Stenotrophomonas]|uniref:hypothetical protein n=2 Tax=Stenotrophomonas TaxID=40323 RepID=UPI0021195A85|nr:MULTISPECIES: hypothetical protein [unclassified Stenotrophomonas]
MNPGQRIEALGGMLQMSLTSIAAALSLIAMCAAPAYTENVAPLPTLTPGDLEGQPEVLEEIRLQLIC